MIERFGWFLAFAMLTWFLLWACAGCSAPARMTGPSIDTVTRASDGQTLTATKITGPDYRGKDTKDVAMPPVRITPDGAVDVGGSGATMWKPLGVDRSWLLLAIGGVALVAGVVLALKFPALALGLPLAAGGAACIGLYFYPWAVLAGAVVWYIGDILQSRRSVNQVNAVNAVAEAAQAEAARQAAALAVVTRAVANSDASTKAAVKRKVADTIAAGSDLDAAIQEAKRT
jgi:hypothetical protein